MNEQSHACAYWKNVNPIFYLHFQATLDTTMITNMLQAINNTIQEINNTTQDLSTRLHAVETKVGAGGVSSSDDSDGTRTAATNMSAATLEQMHNVLRQQGSGSCTAFSMCNCTPPLMLLKTHAAPRQRVLSPVRSAPSPQLDPDPV